MRLSCSAILESIKSARSVLSAANVDVSSSPMSLLYPTTSAARMAVRRRSISTWLLYRNRRGNVTPKCRNAGGSPRTAIRGQRSEDRGVVRAGLALNDEALAFHYATLRKARQANKELMLMLCLVHGFPALHFPPPGSGQAELQ